MKMTIVAGCFFYVLMSQSPALAAEDSPKSDERRGNISESDIPEVAYEYYVNGEYRSIYYKSSDMPLGLAFHPLVNMMHSYEEKLGRDRAIIFVRSKTSLDAGKAEDLLNGLLATRNQLVGEEKQRLKSTLCENDSPRVYGDDAYAGLEAVDDAREGSYRAGYEELIGTLDSDQIEGLNAWIEEVKRDSFQMDLDYRKINTRKGIDINTQTAARCAGRKYND